MQYIKSRYEELCKAPLDIQEHLPTLKEYGEKCYHITEFGVRFGASTVAFLMSYPDRLVSYDWQDFEFYDDLKKDFPNDFRFIKTNVLNIEIEPTDLLFIDTWHNGDQLQKEFDLHLKKVRKYVIIHDTEDCWEVGDGGPSGEDNTGMGVPINKICSESGWMIHRQFKNNHGLTILKYG